MKGEYLVYYSRCPNNGHFILFDPAAPDFENRPKPTNLDTNCPVCGGSVRLVSLQEGYVDFEDHERLWSLKKPCDCGMKS
jgi:hypothetical protein